MARNCIRHKSARYLVEEQIYSMTVYSCDLAPNKACQWSYLAEIHRQKAADNSRGQLDKFPSQRTQFLRPYTKQEKQKQRAGSQHFNWYYNSLQSRPRCSIQRITELRGDNQAIKSTRK